MTYTHISSILIANRGEIACRVSRTAKAMGITTIAVYSEADANAPHVKMADKAVYIGPSPVTESYLVIDRIIQAAKDSGADAVHPGYGFLSENAEFANACKEAGLVFIGPTPKAIMLMGDKAQAKRRMVSAGVPCVPGYQGEAQDDATLLKEAKAIGTPIMVKAAAGGGGRGLRKVTDLNALPNAIKDARSEALNAFGSDVLILEKAIEQPRHVEIQVFADIYGHTIHLGERDCSVQRRHQKVIEEAPCPVMTPELRTAMGEAAVKAAKDIGYVGAGTVEFMLDADGAFYFLEMNTRLQVEHPVTELVTGLDLVALQIKVARGEALGLLQEDINLTGHAIEARLYAEDPALDFLPATGPIHLFKAPRGKNIRVDSGIETAGEVSPYYDPMLAKIMAYGETRDDARRTLIKALKDTALIGVTTNQAFLVDALSHDVFANGDATTAFIAENFSADRLQTPKLDINTAAIAAVLQFSLARDAAHNQNSHMPCEMLNWSSATQLATPYQYEDMRVEVKPLSATSYEVSGDTQTLSIRVHKIDTDHAVMDVDTDTVRLSYYAQDVATLSVMIDAHTFNLVNKYARIQSAADAAGAGSITAPMHGALIELNVSAGDRVKTGDRLAILEAMKMQHEIQADIDGIISAIHVSAGTQVAANIIMIEITPEEMS